MLLEVPMEPFDFPDSDPGPHTLRAGVGEDANTERLVWALTRFTGYTGVTNLARRAFAVRLRLAGAGADLSRATRPAVLRQRRGDALGGARCCRAHRRRLRAGDTPPSIRFRPPMEIDRELSELETQARAHGSASGSGFLYPVTIDARGAMGAGSQRPGLCSGAGIGHSVAEEIITADLHAPSRHVSSSTKTCPIGLASASCWSIARGWCSSAAASTRPSKAGRCRRAASTTARRRCRPRFAR